MEFLGLFHIFTRESDVIDFWEGLYSIILDLSRWELHWAEKHLNMTNERGMQ